MYEVHHIAPNGELIMTEEAPTLAMARAWARHEHNSNPTFRFVVKSKKTGSTCMDLGPIERQNK